MGRYRLPSRFQPIALFIRLRMLRASSADENIQFHLKKGYKQRSLSIEKPECSSLSPNVGARELTIQQSLQSQVLDSPEADRRRLPPDGHCKVPWKWLGVGNSPMVMLIFQGRQVVSQALIMLDENLR